VNQRATYGRCEDLIVPKAKAGLPYRIVKRATDMFARDTGFSGPEIHRLFTDHTDVLGPYTMGGGGASRWELFETGLNIPSVDDQRRFLLDLCTYDGPSKYPRPSDEDIAVARLATRWRCAGRHGRVGQTRPA